MHQPTCRDRARQKTHFFSPEGGSFRTRPAVGRYLGLLTSSAGSFATPSGAASSSSSCTWVECDRCKKWRRLPLVCGRASLPVVWYCELNPDPLHDDCSHEEEMEDDEEEMEDDEEDDQEDLPNNDGGAQKEDAALAEGRMLAEAVCASRATASDREQEGAWSGTAAPLSYAPVPIEPVDADPVERSAKVLASLGDYLEKCGGSHTMIEGWYTKTEFRKEGVTAGTYDSYFFNSQGKRFRSKAEIARYFSLEAAPAMAPAMGAAPSHGQLVAPIVGGAASRIGAQPPSAARKRAREPPPGCFPPTQKASKYSEGWILKSADGSMWRSTQGSKLDQWRSIWQYVEPSEMESMPSARRPRVSMASVPLPEMAPCRHCGQRYRCNGLEQHEARCQQNPAVQEQWGASHALLKQRVERRIATNGLTLADVAVAANISSPCMLSGWLGRTTAYAVSAQRRHEIDELIAAYLDGTAKPDEPATAEEMEAEDAAAGASELDHDLLVQRLERHIATHGLKQSEVAQAANLSSASSLSLWFGRGKSKPLHSSLERKMDVQIAAYLDGAAIVPNAAPPVQPIPQPHRLAGAQLEAARLRADGWTPRLAGNTIDEVAIGEPAAASSIAPSSSMASGASGAASAKELVGKWIVIEGSKRGYVQSQIGGAGTLLTYVVEVDGACETMELGSGGGQKNYVVAEDQPSPLSDARGRGRRPAAAQEMATEAIDAAGTNPTITTFTLGQEVEAKYLAQTMRATYVRTKWFAGVIDSEADDLGRYDVRYDDGDYEEHVPRRFLRARAAEVTEVTQASKVSYDDLDDDNEVEEVPLCKDMLEHKGGFFGCVLPAHHTGPHSVPQLDKRHRKPKAVFDALVSPTEPAAAREMETESAAAPSAAAASNTAPLSAASSTAPPPAILPTAAAEEMEAEDAAAGDSELDHDLLVQRLGRHMATNGLTQADTAIAANIPSRSLLCSWLGRKTACSLAAEKIHEMNELVAAYLDRTADTSSPPVAAPPATAPMAPMLPGALTATETETKPAGTQLPVTAGEDCGQCWACRDKPRFGGPGKKRKRCLARTSEKPLLATASPAEAGAAFDSITLPPLAPVVLSLALTAAPDGITVRARLETLRSIVSARMRHTRTALPAMAREIFAASGSAALRGPKLCGPLLDRWIRQNWQPRFSVESGEDCCRRPFALGLSLSLPLTAHSALPGSPM